MKKSIALCIIALFLVSFQYSFAQEKADLVLNHSLVQAKKENKKVLLFFHASWCGWCKLMQKNMSLDETKKLFDRNYVLASVDVMERPEKKSLENPGADALLQNYKGEKAGLPFWVILDSDGKVLTNSIDDKGESLGSPSTIAEVASFEKKLKITSDLNEKELAIIKKVFLKKE